MNNQLYNLSATELRQANNYQYQISQKKFELQLADINLKYTNQGIQELVKKHGIEMDIHSIEGQRDNCISRAIDYALDLANNELNDAHNTVISLAYMAISSINSFLRSQQIKIDIPFSTRVKLSEVSSKLIILPNIAFMHLKSEISNLKSLCGVF